MTREQWAKLTDKEKRIKVAKLRGAHKFAGCNWAFFSNGTKLQRVPDYLNDLNAMHEVITGCLVSFEQKEAFMDTLAFICSVNSPATWQETIKVQMDYANATAAQRAEAFVLTMEEEKC